MTYNRTQNRPTDPFTFVINPHKIDKVTSSLPAGHIFLFMLSKDCNWEISRMERAIGRSYRCVNRKTENQTDLLLNDMKYMDFVCVGLKIGSTFVVHLFRCFFLHSLLARIRWAMMFGLRDFRIGYFLHLCERKKCPCTR